MESIVCTGVFGIIAYVTYSKSKQEKASGEGKKARVWMLVSLITGGLAVAGLAAAIVG